MQNSINCITAEPCNKHGVFLVKAEQNSQPCWYYLVCTAAKAPIFKGLLNFLPLNLTLIDYGKIINSGMGAAPPANIVKQIANGDFSEPNPTAQSEIFCLLADTPDGREFFTYLDVPYYLIAKFKEISEKKQEFEYSEYGEILHSDWGKPTPEIINLMKDKYGVETPIF